MRRSASYRHSVILTGKFLVIFAVPLAGHAQDSSTITSSTPYATPTEMLARLESGEPNISMVITAAFEKDRQVNDRSVFLGNYDRYTDAERRAILDGVERIAQGVGSEPLVTDAEYEAFSVLYAVGRDPELSEAYDIPDRLLRIYKGAKKDGLKRIAVDELGQVLRSSPTAAPRIIDLLVSLVNQPVTYEQRGYHGQVPVYEGPVDPDDAVDALFRACEAGVPVLRRLQANRAAIQDKRVQARIDSLARTGFTPGSMRLSSTGMDPCTGPSR